jgi:anti-sigma B factor antagonist
MASELNISENTVDGIICISLVGEVDIYTSQNLKHRLYEIVEQNKVDVRINCSELEYIDSTGLGIMVGALKKAKQNGNQIFISNLKDNIKKLFLITGLDKVFVLE